MNRDLIEQFLNNLGIVQFYIKSNLTVDIYESICISNLNLKEIPFKINKVKGYFDCSDNQLTSLKNCPVEVTGFFDCSQNELTSLEFGPKKVGTFYNCYNNKLNDLKHLPKKILGSLDYRNNNLTDNYFESDVKIVYTSLVSSGLEVNSIGKIMNIENLIKFNKRKMIIKKIIEHGN